MKRILTVGFDLDKGCAFVQEWKTDYICGIGFNEVKDTKYFRSIPEAHDYVNKIQRGESNANEEEE